MRQTTRIIQCPACTAYLEVRNGEPGESVECPRCHEPFQLTAAMLRPPAARKTA